MSFGATCTACPSGSAYCFAFLVEDVPAAELPGVSVAEITDGSGATCSVASGALPLGFVGLILLGRRQRLDAGNARPAR